LLDRHPVCWVNTIGTRTPRLDWDTLRRGVEKIGHWLRPRREAPHDHPALRVANPKMWPWFGTRLGRSLNRKLLRRHLTPRIHELPQPVVAVTTIPLVADLMGDLPVERWVYYCVDDFGQWPGLDQSTLQRMERRVVEQADVVIAVSENLRERLAGMGRRSHLLTHGVDVEFWAAPKSGLASFTPEVGEKPWIVFWGVVDRRMDVEFVERLARSLARGTILLAGPNADPDPRLDSLPRVQRLGSLPFDDLPALARDASVLIMPYADLPVTRAIQPLKLKEYLATGMPVVVRDLPANRAWADCLDLAATPDSFVQAVLSRLETGLPANQRSARTRLGDESWDAKADAFERWVFGVEPKGQAPERREDEP
jgi:glycosyltransferase involved in cell wall biosynthesis